MNNKSKCNIKEPHSHLVAGQTFECEKGQQDELKKCEKCMGIGIFECKHNTLRQTQMTLHTIIEQCLPKEKTIDDSYIVDDQMGYSDCGYNDALSDVKSIIPPIVELLIAEIEKDMKNRMKNWHGTGTLMVEDYFNLLKQK